MKTRKTKKLIEFTNVLSARQLRSIVCGTEAPTKADPVDCEGGQVPIGGICMDPDVVGGIDVDGCSDLGIP